MNRVFLPAALLLGSTAACATILDFQDPTDRVSTAEDVDAHAPESATSSSSSSSSSSSTSTSGSAIAPSDAGALVGDAAAGSSVKLTATECSCVPSAPAGWRGPFVVAQGASGVPTCSTGSDYPVTAYSGRWGYAADPAECSCSCEAPVDVACSVPTTSFFADSNCSKPACHVDSNVHACADVVACDVAANKVTAASFGASTPSGGRCNPSATTKVNPAGWRQTIRLCAPLATASDCDGGVCQPTPSPLFGAKNRCVIQDGEIAACPASFPVRQVFYAGGSDTRACSACECGAPEGVTCTGTATTGTAATCKEPITVTTPSGCVAMPAGEHLIVNRGTSQGTGSCTAKGGEAIGAFDPGLPTTVCCLE